MFEEEEPEFSDHAPISTRVRYAADDAIYQVHEYNLDLKANHIYLVGEESLNRDEEGEPGVEFGMANRFIRNLNILMNKSQKPILVHMKTCFSRKTPIVTSEGVRPIKDVKVGDRVLTHTGEYQPVTDVMSQMYDDDMVKLFYGRSRHHGTSITATKDHPVWVERNGVRDWVPMHLVVEGDILFVEAGVCEQTGEPTPFWKRIKNYDAGRLRCKGNVRQADLNIIEACQKLQAEGWTVVPTDTNVRPDIVGFKDGRVVVFEVENQVGKSLEVKREKYDGSLISDFVDDIVWLTRDAKHAYSWYEPDTESPFIKVKVTSTKRWKNKYKQRVYNLTVAESNSYVANHVVVHNCGGDWTEGMAIYDMLLACPNRICVLNYTHARSMSSLILSAADKRVMMPHSTFMFHQGTSGFEGTYKQMQTAAVEDAKCYEQMVKIYVDVLKTSGKMKKWSRKRIRTWLESEMKDKEEAYFSAEEAVELGFADEVFGSTGTYDWEALLKF